MVALLLTGSVTVKVFSDSQNCSTRNIKLKDSPLSIMPDVVAPAGLSQDRSDYLYKEIREFCKEQCKDIVCPQPIMPPAAPGTCCRIMYYICVRPCLQCCPYGSGRTNKYACVVADDAEPKRKKRATKRKA